MELGDAELALLDPETMQSLHSERIQQIRVWGVGRNNGRQVFPVVCSLKSVRTFRAVRLVACSFQRQILLAFTNARSAVLC